MPPGQALATDAAVSGQNRARSAGTPKVPAADLWKGFARAPPATLLDPVPGRTGELAAAKHEELTACGQGK